MLIRPATTSSRYDGHLRIYAFEPQLTGHDPALVEQVFDELGPDRSAWPRRKPDFSVRSTPPTVIFPGPLQSCHVRAETHIPGLERRS